MAEKTLKSGWRRVKFGDVVTQVKDRVADAMTSGLTHYVRGEDFSPGEIKLASRSELSDGQHGPAFHMRFKKGDVLYVSRNPRLRKAAVPDFDGICANTTYVCRADSSRLIQELLPFVMQTEAFSEYAKRHQRGSTNFYVNWSDIAPFEFALPPLEKQREIVYLLSAVTNQLTEQQRLLQSSEVLYYSAIDYLYYGREAQLVRLDKVTSKIVDGVHKTPNYLASGVPFLTVENLTRGLGIDFTATRFVSHDDHKEMYKRANPERGDVLVSKDGTLGVSRYVDTDIEFSIFVSLALLKPDRTQLSGKYLRYFFDSSEFRRRIGQKTSGSAIKHIHLVDFRGTEIPLPPIEVQEQIANRVFEVEETLLAANARISGTKELMRALIGELMFGDVRV